jgi:hypothetical protein
MTLLAKELHLRCMRDSEFGFCCIQLTTSSGNCKARTILLSIQREGPPRRRARPIRACFLP